jgi:hypothetical protein
MLIASKILNLNKIVLSLNLLHLSYYTKLEKKNVSVSIKIISFYINSFYPYITTLKNIHPSMENVDGLLFLLKTKEKVFYPD